MNLLETYTQKNLVIRKGTWYTLILEDGKGLKLARSKADAEKALQNLQQEGKLPEATKEGPQQQQPLSQQLGTLNEAIPTKNKKTETLDKAIEVKEKEIEDLSEKELEAVLGTINDIKPSIIDEMAVYYKDVYAWDFSNPVIAALPVTFYWKIRGKDNCNIIDDGNGRKSCDNWQVFMTDSPIGKLIMKHLRVTRNDTQALNFITNADHVLCIGKKDQYLESQRQKTLNGMRGASKERDRRLEIGNNVGKQKVDEAMQKLSSENANDAKRESDHQKDYDEIEMLKNQL